MERARDEVARILQERGPSSVAELAVAIGVSEGSVRRHLDIMVSEGLLDTRLERRIAIKVLAQHLAENAEWLRRFRREARAVAALNHPNIVTIHALEESEGTSFLAMEMVEGRTLSKIIADKRPDYLAMAVDGPAGTITWIGPGPPGPNPSTTMT